MQRFRQVLCGSALLLLVLGCGGPAPDPYIEGQPLPPTPPPPPVTSATEAVERIRALGGVLVIDEKSPDKPVIAIDLSEKPISTSDLSACKFFPQLQTLNLSRAGVTDEALEHMGELVQQLDRVRTSAIRRER